MSENRWSDIDWVCDYMDCEGETDVVPGMVNGRCNFACGEHSGRPEFENLIEPTSAPTVVELVSKDGSLFVSHDLNRPIDVRMFYTPRGDNPSGVCADTRIAAGVTVEFASAMDLIPTVPKVDCCDFGRKYIKISEVTGFWIFGNTGSYKGAYRATLCICGAELPKLK